MYKRFLDLNLKQSSSVFMLGPRACGKTFWIRENIKNLNYINLLDPSTRMDLEADPSRLVHYLSKSKTEWIVIDEIQKIPALLDIVHKLIEEEKRRFILTGSSARKIRRSGVNLLAGRALSHRMYPLTAIELGDDFDISKSLQFGHLPSIYDKKDLDPKEYLLSYVSTYLKEEVNYEGFTRNLGAFSRFLEYASFSQASTLNMSEIAREAGIKTNTVASYFDLLEDMLIAYRIPVFSKRAKRKLISHPKFFFFDAGVYQHLRPRSILDAVSEVSGPALETLILQDLMAINSYKKLSYQFFYWRTVSGNEVDLILLGEKKLIAIEVKHARKVSKFDLKSLKSFQEDYPKAELFLVYLGDKKLNIDSVSVIPAPEFLKNIPKYL